MDHSSNHLGRASDVLDKRSRVRTDLSISSTCPRRINSQQDAPVSRLPTQAVNRWSVSSVPSSHRRSGSWFSHRPSRVNSASSWRQSVASIDPKGLDLISAFDKPSPSVRVDPLEFCISEEEIAHADGDEMPPNLEIGRDLMTRNCCIVGLACGWALGIASLGIGAYMLKHRLRLPAFLLGKTMAMGSVDYPRPPRRYQMYYFRGHRVCLLPEAATILVPLLLTVLLTLVLDCMNYIHSVTLRWALWHEGRLSFNSNLRLFTSAKLHGPNRWYMNAVSALSTILTYGAMSVLTYNIYLKGVPDDQGALVSTDVQGARYGLDFNGTALVGLGIGLLLQAIHSTWCLCCKSGMMRTWSSNPLSNAKACIDGGLMRPTPSAVISTAARSSSSSIATPNELDSPSSLPDMSVTEKLNARSSVAAYPLSHQPAAISCMPSIRHIPRLIWTLWLASLIWTFAVLGIAIRTETASTSFVVYGSGRTDADAFWEAYGQVYFGYYGMGNRRDWAGLLIQVAVQGIITLALHCVELLTNLMRDERIWRKAGKETGTRPDTNSTEAAATSWPALMLFAFKAVMQWVFGCAFSTNLMVFMNLLPLIAFSVLLFFLAIFTEYLARHKPAGPQPSTFGNLQALAELVDEWHERMWWGDKGSEAGDVRKAGTAGQILPPVKMGSLYTGICAEPGLWPRR